MGMFKQVKQLIGVTKEAPAMIEQARLLQAQAEQMQARQFQGGQMQAGAVPGSGQAGAAFGGAYGAVPQPAAPAEGDPRLASIEGVTLEQYARVSKVAATRGLDEAGLAAHVSGLGFDPAVWKRATEAWNVRFKGDMQLATHFGRLYQEAQV